MTWPRAPVSKRPRLPWAARLRSLQRDPRPVIELLELLKDDPELFVRRSVANNLNDIGKDHPDLLVETCRRWLRGGKPDREWIVRHALRSAAKRGEPGALALLGTTARRRPRSQPRGYPRGLPGSVPRGGAGERCGLSGG